MASRTTKSSSRSGSSRSSSSNGNGRKREQPKRKQQESEYEETPDFGSAFHRPDNEPPQPRYTGDGLLSIETLRAIKDADGAFQIAVWTRRTKSGLRQLRFHIEPPWDGGEEDLDDDFEDDDDDQERDDDVPF